MKELLSYIWAVELEKISRGGGPRTWEKLGFLLSPPDIFSKGHFPECDVIKGGGGELHKNMKK